MKTSNKIVRKATEKKVDQGQVQIRISLASKQAIGLYKARMNVTTVEAADKLIQLGEQSFKNK